MGLGLDRRIIFKRIKKKLWFKNVKWTHLVIVYVQRQSFVNTMTKFWVRFQLSYYQFLQNDSTPWNLVRQKLHNA